MTTMTNGLHPGARLLCYLLGDLTDDDGKVMVRSSELLRATGWANRASLRKRTHELEDPGVVSVERAKRADGGHRRNLYVPIGDDHR